MFDTSFLFESGKVAVILDGGAGSSGKGKLGSFIGEHAGNWQFCCHAFMSNAAHWVVLDDNQKHLYQSLSSVAHLKDAYEKMYICGGAVLELEPLLKEIERYGFTPKNLGIHPIVAIVQQKDVDYERGLCNFDGDPFEDLVHSDCMKLGSTLHGVGAARARRILRRSDVLVARDVPELQPFICQTQNEIMDRLDGGQSGILEVAQGFQLGYLSQFYPKVTSRNCSVSAGLDDCCLPPSVVGDVVINFRTFPIRVNSNKYVHSETNKVLTSDDMEAMKANGTDNLIRVLKGDSGGCYDDQQEVTWDHVTESSGIKEIDPGKEIRERSSLTKLERRVYTFSKKNMFEAIRFNNSPRSTVHISINFINYIDAQMEQRRGGWDQMTEKAKDWVKINIMPSTPEEEKIMSNAVLSFVGTGARTDDMIVTT